MSEWQDIDTAPMDGTEILTAEPSDGEWFLRNCSYDKDRYGGTWVASEYDAFNQNPTHWMRLPQPPKEKK